MDTFRSERVDPALATLFRDRRHEHENGFTLIASENYPHPEDVAAFRDAQDAGFDGKYGEGYPPVDGKELQSGRFYQGLEQFDLLERMAQRRIAAVLAASAPDEARVNVQAPSGAVANLAAYFGIMKPGDAMVAPSLKDGYGHLSHGADSPSAVGKIFTVHGYGIDPETGLLDYDALERLVEEKKPRVVLGGASSYPRDIDWERIVKIAKAHDAITMADISHPAGLIAAGILNDPYAAGVDVITTTTHKTLRGEKGAVILWRNSLAERLKKEGQRGINPAVFPGMLGGPSIPTIAAHASTFRRAHTAPFREEQRRTASHAKLLAAELKKRGWKLATDGTDNHIVLADVTNMQCPDGKHDGWSAGIALENVGIIANKNAIPNTEGTPVRPAGLRMGAQGLSVRGLGAPEVQELAAIIDATLRVSRRDAKIGSMRSRIHEIARAFPIPEYS